MTQWPQTPVRPIRQYPANFRLVNATGVLVFRTRHPAATGCDLQFGLAETNFGLRTSKVLIMERMAIPVAGQLAWRNSLILLLAFAISSFSSCPQAACNINCSLSGAGALAGFKDQQGERAGGSVARARSEHCHDEATADDTQAKSLRSPSTNCRHHSCLPKEITATQATSAGNWPTPTQTTGSQTPDRVVSTQSEPLKNNRLPGPTAGFLDVLVLSGTLRI